MNALALALLSLTAITSDPTTDTSFPTPDPSSLPEVNNEEASQPSPEQQRFMEMLAGKVDWDDSFIAKHSNNSSSNDRNLFQKILKNEEPWNNLLHQQLTESFTLPPKSILKHPDKNTEASASDIHKSKKTSKVKFNSDIDANNTSSETVIAFLYDRDKDEHMEIHGEQMKDWDRMIDTTQYHRGNKCYFYTRRENHRCLTDEERIAILKGEELKIKFEGYNDDEMTEIITERLSAGAKRKKKLDDIEQKELDDIKTEEGPWAKQNK